MNTTILPGILITAIGAFSLGIFSIHFDKVNRWKFN